MVDSLCEANSLPTNWKWPEDRSSKWERGKEWQEFADRWYNANKEELRREDRVLDLGSRSGFSTSPIERLFIRECYVKAEELAWKRAAIDPETGVIVTGQPGIGKTVFIWYFLVSLLQKKQVVLFHTSHTDSILFYHGGVYVKKAAAAHDLPWPSTPSLFIWSLFDIKKDGEPPEVATDPSWCFPVQAPSPHESRYKEWLKSRNSFFTGFPLWTREELAACTCLHNRFPELMRFLDGAVQHWGDVDMEGSCFPGVFRFLKKTQGQDAPNSRDEAFNILLDALATCFGLIPRDVISAMFNFSRIEGNHAGALLIGLEELKDVALDLGSERQFPHTGSSHCIISLNHDRNIEDQMAWQVNFKSEHIGKQVSNRFFAAQERDTRMLITRFSSLPETRGLAGYFFEPLAHRAIMVPVAVGTWSLKKMILKKQSDFKAPHFALPDQPSEVNGFSKIERKRVPFDSINIPADLQNDNYYVANVSSLPFFDSFLVDLKFATRSADIWILQMTTAASHRGPLRSYAVIHKIMMSVRELLERGEDPTGPPPVKKGKMLDVLVKVHYVLIRPGGNEEGLMWELPEGWEKHIAQNNHQGDGYVLDIPCSEMLPVLD